MNDYKDARLKIMNGKFSIWKDRKADLWYLCIGVAVIKQGKAEIIKARYNTLIENSNCTREISEK